jgi:hypothetical protein
LRSYLKAVVSYQEGLEGRIKLRRDVRDLKVKTSEKQVLARRGFPYVGVSSSVFV